MKFSQVMTCIRKSDSTMNKTINDEEVLNSILEFPTIVTVRNILRIFFFFFFIFSISITNSYRVIEREKVTVLIFKTKASFRT